MSLLKSDTIDDKEEFTRRAIIIGAAQGGLLAILGTRLGWLQLAEGQRYKMLSDKNRIDLKMLTPQRGEIYDRNGKPIAINQQNFRILLTPEQCPSPEAALETIRKLIGLSDYEYEQAIDNIKRVAKFTSVEVKDQLNWDDLSKIEVNITDLPGVATDIGTIREYPLEDASAHIIGYVGAPTQNDLKKDRLYRMPGFKVGKTGIERQYEDALKGKSGLAQLEVNVTGRAVHELERQEALSGQHLFLTLDNDLQAYTQDLLSAQDSASAVVLDAYSGAIYAMASYPSFDPNLFVRGMPSKTWNKLLNTRGNPLNNKAVSGLYPPASTFKMVTGLAALEAGVVTEHTSFTCKGHYMLNNKRFHCWKKSGHGRMNLQQALEQSCDVYFYEIANKIGIDRLAATARRLGLGSDWEHILAESKSGLVPDAEWKLGHRGLRWRPGDTIVNSIGQGALLASPMQLALMTARLVNGGIAVEPHILSHIEGDRPWETRWPSLNIDPYHLKILRRGMDDVVNSKKGTAFGSRITDPTFAMGGKTGTAQVKRITAAQRAAGVKNEDLEWKYRHHALFVGYAPLDNPRYVCSVVVEHGVGGSRTAAPIAKDILLKAQALQPHAKDPVTKKLFAVKTGDAS